MKIIEIEQIPAGKYLFLKVKTDEGIDGIGEVGAWGFLDACAEVIRKFSQYLIGKNPFEIERHWNYLYRSMYFRGSIIMSALSAIDIALWDIKGKALGVPVYELLGGMYRNKVRCYPAVFAFDAKSMAEKCLELKQKGYDAARLMITGDVKKSQGERRDMIFSAKVEDFVEKVKACRESIGSDFDLILECHRSMDWSEAMTFAREVELYRPLFIEDPIAPDNGNVMGQLAKKINIPVATGERFINIQEFELLFQQQSVQYVRPDVCALGGITPSKKVAAIAEANYVKIVPHNPLGPVSTAACLQLDAVAPNFAIQEFPSFYEQGEEAKMMKEPFEIERGYLVIPQKPGIGIELAEDIQEKFPVKQRQIMAQKAFDGGIIDI